MRFAHLKASPAMLLASFVVGAGNQAIAQEVFGSAQSMPPAPVVIPDTTQETGGERQSVLQRERPDYDPLGVRVGSYIVLPYVNVAETYDDNIFAAPNNTRSDFVTVVSPRLMAKSNFSNHALDFDVGGDFKRNATSSSEDQDNFVGAVNGRLDILRELTLSAGGGYQTQHEDRGSPDAVNGLTPTEYHVTSGHLGLSEHGGRVSFDVNANVEAYDFGSVATSTGTVIDNKDRNRRELSVAPRLAYEIVPEYQAFVQAAYQTVDYDRARDRNGLDRNSNGYTISAGTDLDLGHVINGEVYAGYTRRSYSNSLQKSIGRPYFGGGLLWNVTQITSVRLGVRRSIEETILAGATGFVATGVNLSAEHELRRNILLTASVSYSSNDYTPLKRNENVYGASAGIRYLINHNLSADLGYSYGDRSVDVIGSDYTRNRITLDLRFQL